MADLVNLGVFFIILWRKGEPFLHLFSSRTPLNFDESVLRIY